MVNQQWAVVWDEEAKIDLKEIYEFLQEESLFVANLIRTGVLNESRELAINPYIYQPDRLCLDNSQLLFRAFEKYNYRITYEIDEENNYIYILRIRHSSRMPFEYK